MAILRERDGQLIKREREREREKKRKAYLVPYCGDLIQARGAPNQSCIMMRWPAYCSLFGMPLLGTSLLGTSSKGLSQLGIPDTENKVLSVEVTIKLSPFKAWRRSEYNHAMVTHCQEFLPCPNFDLGSQFTFILFQIRSLPFNCVIANEVSRVGQENKTGHLAHSHKRFKQVLVVSAYGINRYHSLPQDLNPVIF